ncbi:MAG TPA: TetR family transcriptional regulator [Nakamurella sp.]
MHKPTLRDRQRTQTLRDLHDAAVALAREGGLAAATAEAIAERANVSRRTFFNYFPTKEDALLGTISPVVPQEALDNFLERGPDDDGFTAALRLVVAIVHATFGVDLPLAERRDLLIEFPSLRARLAQHVSTAESLVAAALDERAAARGTPSPHADSSRALFMLAGTVLRFAYSRDPDAFTAADGDAIESAISVFRTVFKEMQ